MTHIHCYMINFNHFLICRILSNIVRDVLQVDKIRWLAKGSPESQNVRALKRISFQDIKILLNMRAAILWDVTPCILIEMH